jgi:C_GCAxxG_C_C family probable redox protein
MTIRERADYAAALKTRGGYNCSQAVAAALCDETNLPEAQWKQLAAGFCAGMGTMEATCGALIGAGMVAGVKTQGQGTLRCTRQMIASFREKCGAVTCRELKSLVNGRPLCPCEDCVKNAVLVYGEVMGLE